MSRYDATHAHPPAAGGLGAAAASFFCARGHCPFFRRYDWKQDIGRLVAAEMKRSDAIEYLHRPVGGVVMQERAAASEFVFEVRQLAAAPAAIFVILAADRQRHAIAWRHDNRGRPDFDVQLGDFALFERLD